MFTVELKVNGSLIAHIYGRNIAPTSSGKNRYDFEYYEVESREVRRGTVNHDRADGLRVLVTSILESLGE